MKPSVLLFCGNKGNWKVTLRLIQLLMILNTSGNLEFRTTSTESLAEQQDNSNRNIGIFAAVQLKPLWQKNLEV